MSSTIQGLEVIAGVLRPMIKISGINSHSKRSRLWPRFKHKEEDVVINGSNLSSSKFQMTVQSGIGPRVNLKFILEIQIGTP